MITYEKIVPAMKRGLLFVGAALFITSCSHQAEPTAQIYPGAIVPQPESKGIRAGEKVNMMMLMEAEQRAQDMDEVVVIPPKEKKKPPQQ